MDDGAAPVVKKEESGLLNFIAGGFGGMCLVLVGHPLDLIKVQLQTSDVHKGVLDVAKKTLKADGPKGFYRGVSAPLVASTPIFATCFWGYDLGLKIMRRVHGADAGYKFTTMDQCAAGAISAVPTTVIMAPVERVKCLLQIQGQGAVAGKGPQYTGMVDCATKLYGSGGLRSVFKGWEATLLRDTPASAVYFGVNAVLKKYLADANGRVSDGGILVAGGVAGMANWAVAIPADVIKSRYQTAPEGMYSGLGQVLRTLLKNEGPGALFRGMSPAMMRAFPANAACFFGVDVAKRVMEKFGMT